MSGHTVAEIRAMSQRLRDLATRAAYHRCRAAAHTANAALADREADLVQEQLTKAVRDSQHEVEVVLAGETGAAPPLDPSSTPPVPTKKD